MFDWVRAPRTLEIVSRVLAVALFSIFVARAYLAWEQTHHVTLLLLFAAETLTVFFLVTARFATEVDRSFFATAMTVAATFYFLVVQLTDGVALVPDVVGLVLQVTGVSTQIVAKLFLGRRFGLLPANRGIVDRGPYRLVRHPIYFGYLLNHVGFLLTTWSLTNLFVYVFLYVFQLARISREERVLMKDEAYRAYAAKVRWRIVPGVY